MRSRTSSSKVYIWQLPAWPAMHFDQARLAPALEAARLAQGQLLGQLDAIGLNESRKLGRDLWIQDAMSTAAIEGDRLDLSAVRSSVTRRLGLADVPTHDRHVDGLVEVMQDSTVNHAALLDEDRLCRWQSALSQAASPASDVLPSDVGVTIQSPCRS